MMVMTRREILAGGASAAALAAIGTGAASAQAGPGFKQFKLGSLTITALHDGSAERPLQDGFIRNVKLPDVQAFLAANNMATDKLTINFSNLVIDTGSERIMLDSLTGATLAPTAGKLTENLKAAGIDPASITSILISHFHPDHINGLAAKEGMARFDNAEIRVAEAEWAFWMDEARMSAAPEAMQGAFKNAMGVFGPLKQRVRPYKSDETLAGGVVAVAAPGHTPGHTVFAVSSGGQNLMFMADTTNDPRIFAANPDWQVMFDMDGNQAAETRKKLLDRAAADKMQVFFYHAPFPATGMITKKGTGYQFDLMA
jgi:glyoxylase-like metal-dependent hydrolase (beta-lactamase superfamily II)